MREARECRQRREAMHRD